MNQIPEPLKKGDTLGIIAPAGAFSVKKFNVGLDILSSNGFKIHIPDGLFKRNRYLAGEDEHRADLLNTLFQDDQVKGILCARGGFGSMRILPFLDYQMIAAHPKRLIGFSDISALLSALFQQCGLICFHGPTITSIGDITQNSVFSLIKAISSSPVQTIRPGLPAVICKGSATGRVIGGNLTTLCHMIGTPFDIDYSDKIVFFEETKEAPYRIDRMLTQLRMAGKFEHIRGILLGDFNDCGKMSDIYHIADEIFNPLGIPVLGGFEIGHSQTNLTLPIGMHALLDTNGQILELR